MMLPLLVALQAAPPVHATPTFEAAFRSGLSVPVGFARSQVSMRDITDLQIPVMLEMGARLTPRVFIGGYAGVGLGTMSPRFDQNYCASRDCASRTAHAGAEIHLHIRPTKQVDPWIGFGVGYEWFFSSGTPKVHMNGFEAFRPMLGVDLRLSQRTALGFFVDTPIAVYTSYDAPPPSGLDTRIHTWVTFGLRLVLQK